MSMTSEPSVSSQDSEYEGITDKRSTSQRLGKVSIRSNGYRLRPVPRHVRRQILRNNDRQYLFSGKVSQINER